MKSTLLHGDCLELMKTIPDGSIDMVLSEQQPGICRYEAGSGILPDGKRED